MLVAWASAAAAVYGAVADNAVNDAVSGKPRRSSSTDLISDLTTLR